MLFPTNITEGESKRSIEIHALSNVSQKAKNIDQEYQKGIVEEI